MRRHRGVQHALCRVLQAAGAEVDLERVIPELGGRPQAGRRRVDAILDLNVTFPGATQRYLIDVSIRCPHAARYRDADKVVGVASAAAAKEKQDTYGLEVLPLAFESYGRFGAGSRDTLTALAHAACAAAGGDLPRRLFWRCACETPVLFASADVALLALGGRGASHIARG